MYREPVRTFSIGFTYDEYNELAHARVMAERFDTEHHEYIVDATRSMILPRIVCHYGEPFADSSAVPSFYLAEMARRQVTVALNGDGGDETFAGYSRYERVAVYDGDATPRPGVAPEDEHLITFFSHLLSWDYFGAPERPGFYTPEFLAELGERPFLSVLADPYLASDAEDALGRIIDVDLQTRLGQDILVKVDIASMAHSLEVRSPLLDHVLLETAAAIPSAMKLAGGDTKRIYKNALRDWLPDEVLDRPKMGFAVPLCAWFRTERSDLARDVLLDSRSLGRGLFRAERVERLLDDHLSGPPTTRARSGH